MSVQLKTQPYKYIVHNFLLTISCILRLQLKPCPKVAFTLKGKCLRQSTFENPVSILGFFIRICLLHRPLAIASAVQWEKGRGC